MKSQLLEELYKRHYENLLRYAAKFIWDKDYAHDIVIDSFIKLFQSDFIESPNAKFVLYTIVRNTAITWRRHAKHQTSFIYTDEIFADEKIDIEEAYIEANFLAEISSFTKDLEPRAAEIFNLLINGFRVVDVMRLLNISRQNVLNQKTVALKYIKQKFYDFRIAALRNKFNFIK